MFTKEETNFCKGTAVILMLFHHLFYKPESYAKYALHLWPFSQNQLTWLAYSGKLCVAVFAFLSGYGIAATYRKAFGGRTPSGSEVWNFTWKRYWKLMTGFWFIFLLVLLLQPLGRTLTDAYGTKEMDIAAYLAIDFLGLNDLLYTPSLNPTWWYLSTIIVIIFALPILLKMTQQAGCGVLISVFLLSSYLFDTRTTSLAYVNLALIGALCFEVSFFERADRLWSRFRFASALKFLLAAVLFLALMRLRMVHNDYRLTDAACTVFLLFLVHTALFRIPAVTQLLQLLGRHSGNIFMTHTLLFAMYFKDFFYSFRHWSLILAALLAASLLCSVALEFLKKATHYNDSMARLGKKFLQ